MTEHAFASVLVANRGEIAIRAFRAARELGLRTIAVFPHEDRGSEHRVRADEAFQIGDPGHPVRAYLDAEGIVAVARQAGAEAIYPGYGFLAENPDLAEACARAGMTFVGPSAEVLELTGNKAAAIDAAQRAGLPVLRSVPPSTDVEELVTGAAELRFPVFVKAVAGGGGRGMRRVASPGLLRDALGSAMREAEGAFGDRTCFIEEAVVGARHIEVQVLADRHGGVVHLGERDCSVQRRHQKVVEMAPAPALDATLREHICSDGVRFAQAIGYVGAGTVEFLLGADGRYVFIEMNPRIQVEHTVTEEVSGVDLVTAQLRIAAGASLTDLGLPDQDAVVISGFALQCRVTTEDPANGFRPATGTITAYRSPGGPGVRLDGGTAYTGAQVGGHFDSLLTKLTCRGRDFPAVVGRARRALREFVIEGVPTNVPFLRELLDHDDFRHGSGVTTTFIDDHPDLLGAVTAADDVERLLAYLADVTVNRPFGAPPTTASPRVKLPDLDSTEPPSGTRQRLRTVGPEEFARELREQRAVAVTDTTFRDAHQSLLATRLRTADLIDVAPHVATSTPQLWSVEAWGGATYDVALRFLKEDPWDRLARLRGAIPNICLQMLIRGRNTVGYAPYPDEVTRAFVEEAATTGIDVFRIFDALNDVDRMRPAIDAVRSTGTSVAEVALCYTGDLLDPAERLYTLDYYLRLAERIVESGAHVLAIKDMAGLLRVPAARTLVTALRERFDLPVHLHTHDTPGGQLATLVAAVDAGVDAVDTASSPLSGTTSQPPLSALVAATDHTDRATGIDLSAVCSLEPYWEAVRELYAPFESGLRAPTGRVYRHQIPGGQLSNLRQQAAALGLEERFEQIEGMYAAANDILGNIVKVTPSSKVVGDLALQLVASGADPEAFAKDPAPYDLPDSVVGFLAGELGTPAGGWPEPFRSRVMQNRQEPSFHYELSDEQRQGLRIDRQATLDRLLFPEPAAEHDAAVAEYGDLSVLPSAAFWFGMRPGQVIDVELGTGRMSVVGIDAIGEVDDHGMRTVIGTIDGRLRTLRVRDYSATVTAEAAAKADASDPKQIAVPYTGVVRPLVQAGDRVVAGQPLASIEAMKMEAVITAPSSGTVERVLITGVQQADGGDLLLVLA